MKVHAIKSYTQSTFNKPAQNINKQNVSFGFGEDYGSDEFLHDSDHSDGNLFEYLGLIIEFPITLIQEKLEERRAIRRAARAEELAQSNREIDIDNTDIDDEDFDE